MGQALGVCCIAGSFRDIGSKTSCLLATLVFRYVIPIDKTQCGNDLQGCGNDFQVLESSHRATRNAGGYDLPGLATT